MSQHFKIVRFVKHVIIPSVSYKMGRSGDIKPGCPHTDDG